MPELCANRAIENPSRYLQIFRQKYQTYRVQHDRLTQEILGKFEITSLLQNCKSLLIAAKAYHKNGNHPCRLAAFSVALEESLAELAERFGLLPVIEAINGKASPRVLPFEISQSHAEWGKTPGWAKRALNYEAGKHTGKLGSSALITQGATASALPFDARNWRKYRGEVSVPSAAVTISQKNRTLIARASEAEARQLTKPL